jgi:hypothetical protein
MQRCRADVGARRDARQRSYFNDVFIELKLVFSVLPIPLTATRITMLKPAAIRQYSIAVAPD